jgi:hypothetical protein
MDDIGSEIRAALAAGLDDQHADIAAFLEHPLTLVEPLPAPFLHRYGLYRVMPRHLSHPVLLHLAGGKGLVTHVLGPDSATLTSVVQDDSSTLDDAPSAVGFVEALIEVVGPRPGLVRLVSSIDDIPFRDELTEDDAAAKAAGEAALADQIGSPSATRDGEGWRVTAWVARGQAVQREVFVVSTTGQLISHNVEVTVDLPLIVVA